jgi:polysaccharide export outer membrane protein
MTFRTRWMIPFTLALAVGFSSPSMGQTQAPEPATPVAVSPDYQLRAGDVLNVTVWGFPEFSVAGVPVRPDGKVSFPTIGDIYVVGQTPDRLSRIVALGIKKYVADPKVSVTLISSSTQKYFVTGSVAAPGSFPLTTGTGVREAVVAAGDLAVDANVRTATLIRDGKRIPVDLAGAMRGDAAANLTLEPGDTLSIDRAIVSLEGSVNNTGQQPLRRGGTLTQALATAGGPKEGADIERVQILRGDETLVANLREISNDPSKDIALQPGDIIKVDAADERTVPVFLTGSVGRRGAYRYLPGRRDTLQDAINWAGGAGSDADLSRVKVRRTDDAGELHEYKFDMRNVDARGFQLQPNDYIEVSRKKRSAMSNLSAVAGSLGVVVALFGLLRR